MSLRDAVHSIRFKIIAPVIAVVALASLGASVVSAALTSQRIVANSLELMNVSAAALQGGVSGSVWNYDSSQTLKALAPVADQPDFRLALVLDSEGKPFAQLLGKGVSEAAAADTVARLKAAASAAGAPFTEIEQTGALTRSYPLHHVEDGKDSVIGALIFSSSTLSAARESRETLLLYVGASLVVLIGLSILLFAIVSRVSGPISRISAAMNDLAHGDLAVDVEGRDRRDEIGAMAQAVQVFKENAVERHRLERDAADVRAATEAERERATGESRRVAAEQTQAMQGLAQGLSRLASGDLTTRLGSGFAEPYLRVRDDFNAAVDKLKSAMLAVVASTGTISSGTQEVSSASDDLSRRTVQQASSLEETAAALGEITSTVRKSAEGAGQARNVVAAADENAKNGAVVVREAVSAMDAIARSAQEISQIIGVIDEIAFQTNLLALNAGVEAARAGEFGRGFAVVASEVRALAQRSAQAAKEIKALITASTTQVGRGVKLVAETGQSLERIVAQVGEINAVVAGIAAGADQQATALAEVNSALGEMDQMTQQNAAMVEETTAASRSLSRQIEELAGLIAQFQVDSAPPWGGDRLAA